MVPDYFLSWNLSPEDPFPHTEASVNGPPRSSVLKPPHLSGVGIFKSICELEGAGVGAYLWLAGGDPHSR